jgi:methionyl-tRNA synthetase
MSQFYVTTPIYYVNDLPHIGHIYTTVVADTVARYRRMRGDAVHFLTGTDEHGQKIERAAEKEGVEPIELADRVVERYHELWKSLDISHDDFIRTTESRHAAGVTALIDRIAAAGDFYVGEHEGWYCVSCETFYTEKELVQPGNRCPDHGAKTEWRAEENVYFRLSRYQQALLDWIDGSPGCIEPETRRNEVRSFIESGLRDLSVSRANLSWGLPFPGHPGQTVYVWLDALTNYLSGLGFGSEEESLYDSYWQNGDIRLHLIGKDILRHHCVFWPAFLMSAGLPLPTTVWVHGWWLRDERKMSKSVGNIVRPDHLIEAFGADALRYFLLREMVFGQDASFSDEAFVDRFNSDLANDLGNTVSRLVTLSRKVFDGRTPDAGHGDGGPVARAAAAAVDDYHDAMEQLAFQRALAALWGLLAETNQYVVHHEPWKLIGDATRREDVAEILWNGLEAVRIVATGLLPFMPETAPTVLRALGVREETPSTAAMAWGSLPSAAALPVPEPLFPRIDREKYLGRLRDASAEPTTQKVQNEPEGSMISIDQFFQSELRVGVVTSAEPIPKSNKLLRLTVDLGEASPRTLVAGIAKAYDAADLIGRRVVVVANLEPATLMGVESQGMVLAASVDGRPVLLQPDEAVAPGTEVK